jgi:hypothetical protein
MAKNTLRGAQAPGANLASPTATAMDAWRANVDANKANIRKACDAALTSDVRGYSDQLAASTAIGISWDQLVMWKPADVRVVDNATENAIRDVHLIVEPSSSSLALGQFKEVLAALSTACTDASVDHVRKTLGRDSLPTRAKGKTTAEGKAQLDKLRADAVKSGDKAKLAQVDNAINAIDNTDAMVVLLNELNALETANSRFRKRMFLHLVAPQMGAIPEKQRGNEYLRVCSAAYAAHKKFSSLDGQDRTVARLKQAVEKAVSDYVDGKYGVKEKEVKSNEVLGLEAARAIFNATRRAYSLKSIPRTTHDAIIAYLIGDVAKGGAGLEDPEDVRQDAIEAAKQVRIDARNAKLAAEGKAKGKAKGTGKAAGPASSKAKKARASLPPSKPRAPRATQAPAAQANPSVVSTDTDDAEGVLADMHAS